jgi:hypothetical protein
MAGVVYDYSAILICKNTKFIQEQNKKGEKLSMTEVFLLK